MPGSPDAISFYDTAPLRATLLELVDFDRINRGPTRLSVGAVNVSTGNFIYFDSTRAHDRSRHIMASGALPPAFPPITIDGEPYWDGGIVSNTPLQYVLDMTGPENLTVFQVDLFSARGAMPTTPGRDPAAREGHPFLQPHAAEHRSQQAAAEAARCGPAAGGAPSRAGQRSRDGARCSPTITPAASRSCT